MFVGMNSAKWIMIGLIALGLFGFAYKVYLDQQTFSLQISRGPIAVAAVRGESIDVGNPLCPLFQTPVLIMLIRCKKT